MDGDGFTTAEILDGALETLGGVQDALERVRGGCLYLPKALQHDLEVIAQGIEHAVKEVEEAISKARGGGA